MADGKWLKLDGSGVPQEIVTKQPERGVQLIAPGGVEDEVARGHIKAAQDAIKAAKDSGDKSSK